MTLYQLKERDPYSDFWPDLYLHWVKHFYLTENQFVYVFLETPYERNYCTLTSPIKRMEIGEKICSPGRILFRIHLGEMRVVCVYVFATHSIALFKNKIDMDPDILDSDYKMIILQGKVREKIEDTVYLTNIKVERQLDFDQLYLAKNWCDHKHNNSFVFTQVPNDQFRFVKITGRKPRNKPRPEYKIIL
ncbi:hypothetical protein [Candidatus Lokiarchaeum ossiferum]|uniref:hypothetical protein n=1 Tax=Candidatus Lokiarchaeum ossiferum TaxID=2951803 RepID=UPI00352F8ACB